MYEKLDLFVYSGTGNTYKTAECIGRAAKKKGVGYDIGMIDIHSNPEEYKPDNRHLLGLLAPTIGAIQPLSFFGFILRLPRGNGMRVFLAGTGAWTKIGPLFLPGFVGYGLYLAALILTLKGYKVAGVNGFGMPHNWTTLIPPYWRGLEKRINEEIGGAVEDFTFKLITGKKVFKRIGDLVFCLLVFPLPLLFLLIGHLYLAKTMFPSHRCNGCGLCAENCPRQALKMTGGKRKQPYWTLKCEQCMRCAGYCPNKAIEGSTILLVGYFVLFAALPADIFLLLFSKTFFDISFLAGNWIFTLVFWYLFSLFLLVAGYWIFFALNRIPVLNRICSYLSLTFYWRKYRMPDISVAKLTGKKESARKL
jgi:Pyruvate/2-oxoacid:ferredoxin oxidoreductase delta subunit